MADISKITLPSGTTYNLKDAAAREDIEDIKNAVSGGVNFIGSTTTALTDGSTTNPITISSRSVTVLKGNLVTYGDSEFLWDGAKWIFFGDFGSLGALAFKDAASGSFTPSGSVSKPTFTGTEKTVTVSGTPTGSVSITTGTGTANYTPAGDVSKPTFTGTQATISVSGTPTGSVSITTGTGTANYTPAGDVSKPTITVTPNTASIQVIDSVGTAPSCTLPTWTGTVANENLTIGWTAGSFSAGSVPTKKSAQTVVTGIKSATSSNITFTGTGTELIATFTGTSMTSTGSYKPAGAVSKPTFTGTGVELKGDFTGTSFNSTGKFTPEGTVSKPTFTGTAGVVTVSDDPM